MNTQYFHQASPQQCSTIWIYYHKMLRHTVLHYTVFLILYKHICLDMRFASEAIAV